MRSKNVIIIFITSRLSAPRLLIIRMVYLASRDYKGLCNFTRSIEYFAARSSSQIWIMFFATMGSKLVSV